MNKKIMLLVILVLIPNVLGLYTDLDYVYVSNYNTTNTRSKTYQLDLDLLDSYDNIEEGKLFIQSFLFNRAMLLRPSFTQLFVGARYQDASSASIEGQLISRNKTLDDPPVDYPPVGRVFGLAIKDGYVFTAKENFLASHYEYNTTEVWSESIAGQVVTTNNVNNLVVDEDYIYLAYNTAFEPRIVKHFQYNGTKVYDRNFTSEIEDINSIDIDVNFMYYTGKFSNSTYFLARSGINNPTFLINSISSPNNTVISSIWATPGLIYGVSKVGNDIVIYKFNKNLELLGSKTFDVDISAVYQIEKDSRYIYITTAGTEAGLYVLNTEFELINFIPTQTGISFFASTVSYKGGSGLGSAFYLSNLSVTGFVDYERTGDLDTYCELYDNETLIDVGLSLNGTINFNFIQANKFYNLECTLNNEVYPDISIDESPYKQVNEVFVFPDNSVEAFFWFSEFSPYLTANFTVNVFDSITSLPIEDAFIVITQDGERISSSFTNVEGFSTFSYTRCNLCFNVSKSNYDSVFGCFANTMNDQAVFVLLEKNYEVEQSPCYVNGFIEENGEPVSSLMNILCRYNNNVTVDRVDSVFEGEYFISNIPDGHTCELSVFDSNSRERFLTQWTPLSTADTQRGGACSNCACNFNFTLDTLFRYYFTVKHNEEIIIDANLKLYNTTHFIDSMFLDGNRYYSDLIIEGESYTVEVDSISYIASNYTFTANESMKEHIIYVFKDTDSCYISPFTFISNVLYDSDNPDELLYISYTLNDLDSGNRITQTLKATDLQFSKGNTILQKINCLDNYRLTISSPYYDALPKDFTAGGRNSIEIIYNMNAKTKIDRELQVRRMQDLIWANVYWLAYLFLATIVIFFVVAVWLMFNQFIGGVK